METEWVYDKCRNCGKYAMVTFIIGAKDGYIYAGKVCHDCLLAIRAEKIKKDK